MTLREIVNTYGAEGIVMMDDGNGSGGPSYTEWTPEIDYAYGDTEMLPVVEGSNDAREINEAARSVTDDQRYTALYVSEWIEDDGRNAPYRASNPYRYRVIF